MNFDFDLITLLSVDTDLKEHLPRRRLVDPWKLVDHLRKRISN